MESNMKFALSFGVVDLVVWMVLHNEIPHSKSQVRFNTTTAKEANGEEYEK